MNNYVKSLKMAKKLLTVRGKDHKMRDESPFICITLRNIALKHDDLSPYCCRVIEYISDCIGGHGECLERWLEREGYINSYRSNPKLNLKMYEYRLEWIDELIRLYKGKKNDQRT